MSNYSKTTDFAAKDSLPSGDSGKIIRGSEFETEFDAISTAIATKADAADPTFTGTVTIDGLTVNGNTVLGNAATDTVTVTADIASNLIPSADDTYNLGASGAEWNDLHVDGVAYIDTIDGAATSGDFTFTGASYNAVWDTSDNALEFADSAKATFGATGDLQIYHSGTHSFITDVGTGNLYLRGTNLLLTSAAGETYADFTADGAARLYHNGSAKLATTSTGIDVTGSVTADGLTVDGAAQFNTGATGIAEFYHVSGLGGVRITGSAGGSSSTLFLANDKSGGGHDIYALYGNGSNDSLQLYSGGTSGTGTLRAQFASNGDVSFYEDTGTTAKFFWDASAEQLGIGTIFPVDNLHLFDSTNAGIKFTNTTSGSTASDGFSAGFDNSQTAYFWNYENGGMKFATNNAERVRIDSSGNVGIGTDSPDTLLEVVGADPILTIRDSEFSQSATNATLRLAESGGSDTLGNYWDINHTANGQLRFVQDKDGFNTERMRIDSAGNVGIGTSSPDRLLNVVGTDTVIADFENTTATGNGRIAVTTGSSTAYFTQFGQSHATTPNLTQISAPSETRFINAGVTVATMKSSGNVGIGTSSPDAKLVVSEGGTTAAHGDTDLLVRHSQVAGATAQVQILAGNTANSNLYFSDTDSYSVGGFQYNHSSNYLAVRANNSERMRIDSSGNVLVGKTSGNTLGTPGVEIDGNLNRIMVTRDDQVPMFLNRNSTNGIIQEFRKDNSTVGTIGCNTGRFYIHNNYGVGSGFRFDNGSIQPSTSAGASEDNTTDLGASAARFKDLYLSGGAYLGGTAAANKLDDYEEGTWTPVIADAASGGNTGTATILAEYTKIGDLVHIQVYLQNITTTGMTSGNDLFIRNLPFITDGAAIHTGAASVDQLTFSGYLSVEAPAGQYYIRIAELISASNRDFITVGQVNSGVTDIYFTLTYKS